MYIQLDIILEYQCKIAYRYIHVLYNDMHKIISNTNETLNQPIPNQPISSSQTMPEWSDVRVRGTWPLEVEGNFGIDLRLQGAPYFMGVFSGTNAMVILQFPWSISWI